ncbi:MAG: ribosome biogenesis GTPase Der [Candidatus Auribacterota bacterium]
MQNLPKVAIVGRPNVGKSSLFNRLIGMRKAIVDPESGVTRDRIYADMEWDAYNFTLIDTGGINFDKTCSVSQLIFKQAQLGVEEADAIIMLVDGKDGLNPFDKDITELLRGYSKPVVLAINKIDIVEQMNLVTEFYQLGFERIFPVSATHGLGLDDLLIEITTYLPRARAVEEIDIDKITIVGKPNVGKSTLLNAVLKEDRAMVDSVPGTTRDIIDTRVSICDKQYILVDTAGIRHKKKFDNNVETYAFFRTESTIKRSDLVLMLIDAEHGITRQDNRIISMVIEMGKSMLLVVNKWDLIKGCSPKDYIQKMIKIQKHISYVPVIFISALNKSNIPAIFQKAEQVLESSKTKVQTALLNKMISDAQIHRPPPLQNNKKRLKIYYAVQTGIRPPVFTLYVNSKKYLTENYKRYIVNIMRQLFSYEGSPIIVHAKSK